MVLPDKRSRLKYDRAELMEPASGVRRLSGTPKDGFAVMVGASLTKDLELMLCVVDRSFILISISSKGELISAVGEATGV